MSENNSMFAVQVNGERVMAPSQAAAEAIASALGGSVITLSRKEALSAVREATKIPEFPPALSDMLACLKDTIIGETDKHDLLNDSCWRVILQYDSKNAAWYTELKNFGNGNGPVYNQVTGEKYQSIAHARWENGKTCDVKYLNNGIKGDDKFGKTKPAAA